MKETLKPLSMMHQSSIISLLPMVDTYLSISFEKSLLIKFFISKYISVDVYVWSLFSTVCSHLRGIEEAGDKGGLRRKLPYVRRRKRMVGAERNDVELMAVIKLAC